LSSLKTQRVAYHMFRLVERKQGSSDMGNSSISQLEQLHKEPAKPDIVLLTEDIVRSCCRAVILCQFTRWPDDVSMGESYFV
jgi:hypothetical protein